MNVHVLIVLSLLPFLRPLKAENTEQQGTWGIMRNHTKLVWCWWVRCTHNKLISPLRSSHFFATRQNNTSLYHGTVKITGNCMILMVAVRHLNWQTCLLGCFVRKSIGASYSSPQSCGEYFPINIELGGITDYTQTSHGLTKCRLGSDLVNCQLLYWKDTNWMSFCLWMCLLGKLTSCWDFFLKLI